MSSPPENKKIFLIASSLPKRRADFERLIDENFPNSTVYLAEDGPDALAKASNVPPHVLIMDVELPKMSGLQILDQILHSPKFSSTAIVAIGTLPAEILHADEFVTGRLQYFGDGGEEGKLDFSNCISRALNFAFHGKNTEYQVRFLGNGERLLTEGEKGESVFIVKEGRLRAFRIVEAREVLLGHVEKGEFVGEMAYINGEPRTANVEAITACELIEVPVGTLERVLYRRPSWSKTLLQTLARRLKQANDIKVAAK